MIRLLDTTLRDGSHANKHSFTPEQVSLISARLDSVGLDVVEVGHGNGLGASSFQIGLSSYDDTQLLRAAKNNLLNTRLGTHCIPGISTYDRDVSPAIEEGVNYFRVGCHCTEANLTESLIKKISSRNIEVWGSLMMTHMTDINTLIEQCLYLQDYGASGITLYDSAGTFLPSDVDSIISAIFQKIQKPIGFHAHNNLGMASANALQALQAGAQFIDGSLAGYGAGAGNLSLPHFAAALTRTPFQTTCNWENYLTIMDDLIEQRLIESPFPSSLSVTSGINGVFSGFIKHIVTISSQYKIRPSDLFKECGKHHLLAGQEDLIIELATQMSYESQKT